MGVERAPNGAVVDLPKPTTKFPREKPLPEPKPETRWEKFAKIKGIKNKKQSKWDWDEAKQEWSSRSCRVSGTHNGVIRKYNMNICRRFFREYADKDRFPKARLNVYVLQFFRIVFNTHDLQHLIMIIRF